MAKCKESMTQKGLGTFDLEHNEMIQIKYLVQCSLFAHLLFKKFYKSTEFYVNLIHTKFISKYCEN